MSEFHVKVIRIGAVTKHSNADSLSITEVTGYPVIFRTGDFMEGDKAVYVPIDAVVPGGERWAFLKGHTRIRAARLRGVFSMGLLAACDPAWEIGQDVRVEMGITKFEPEEPAEGNLRDPGHMPVYTDIVGLRPNPNILIDGEEVVITEKIHGESARYVYAAAGEAAEAGLCLWAGSRTNIKDQGYRSHWWKVAERLDLLGRLRAMPGIAIYGEVFGDVRGMKYGATSDDRDLRLFDALDTRTRTYADFDDFLQVSNALGLGHLTAPVLYRGPWSHDLRKLAEGNSELASHVREGIVVRPVKERWDQRIGRVILKLHGEGYLLRKEPRE